MAVKRILVPLDGVDEKSLPLKVALELAKGLNAHVDAHHAGADPKQSLTYLGEGMTSAMIQGVLEAAEADAQDRIDRAKRVFNDTCASEGVDVVSRDEITGDLEKATASSARTVGAQSENLARRGRLSDLTVVPRPQPDEDVLPPIALETVLLETGKPVLVVPPEIRGEKWGDRALVAWNGSPEGARALAFSLPLLRLAETVDVLCIINDGVEEVDLEAVTNYLAWHGVRADAHATPLGVTSQGEALLEKVEEMNCDFLVMGAYTHSRFRQLVFGGVTQTVLDESPVPVLMAH